jgi:hypothetical protein
VCQHVRKKAQDLCLWEELMNIANITSFLAGLSVATERVTEIVKGLPGLSTWFSVDKKVAWEEELRKASVQLVAVVAGTVISYMAADAINSQLNIPNYDGHKLLYSVIAGLLASGGSGIWNSALDIVRQVNTQKQLVTDKMKQAA